jgi:hypothetical protein
MKALLSLLGFGLASAIFAFPASAKSPGEQYAACLVQTRPAQVEALLHASSAAAAHNPYYALADDERCFTRIFGNKPFRPEDAGTSMDMLRGRLAEQALLSQSRKVEALEALPLQQQRYVRPWFAATGRHPAVDEMAACMADTDPKAILTLVGTTAGSEDENAAISGLSSSLTKCLSAGTRLDASRQALRAALADALYQRLQNPSLSLANLPTERSH